MYWDENTATAFSLTDVMNSVSALVGVNPGYDGDNFSVTDPEQAALIVDAETKKLGIPARVFPGRVLYPQDRGCPKGGEVVGAVFTSPGPGDLLDRFNKTRINLKQETLSVITTPDSGSVMAGFIVNFGPGDLSKIALAWQETAAGLYRKLGFHVSGAVYEADGQIFGQAEANPTRIKDMPAWQTSAGEIIKAIRPDASPVFRHVGYHYLKE